MRRTLLAAAVTALTLAPAGGAGSAAQPSLRVVKRTPLTVVGSNFNAAEKVVLTVAWQGTHRLKRIATAAGTFRATFTDVGVSRCDRLTGRAAGSKGSNATVKLLPAPGCVTQ